MKRFLRFYGADLAQVTLSLLLVGSFAVSAVFIRREPSVATVTGAQETKSPVLAGAVSVPETKARPAKRRGFFQQIPEQLRKP